MKTEKKASRAKVETLCVFNARRGGKNSGSPRREEGRRFWEGKA